MEDKSVLFRDGEKKADKSEEHVLSYTSIHGPVATLRLEILPDDAHGGNIYRGDQTRLAMGVRWKVIREGGEKSEVLTISRAYANLDTENYFNGFLKTSLAQDFKSSRHHSKEAYELSYFLKDPVDWQEGDILEVVLKSEHLGRVRVSYSPLGQLKPEESISQKVLNAFKASEPSNAQKQSIAGLFVRSRKWHKSAYPELLDLCQEIADCRDGLAFTAITQSTDPLTTRVLGRGDWQDESGEIVYPSVPEFLLGETPALETQRLSRLDLAYWMTSPDNPLTSRAFVNRLWAQLFGAGLSAIVDDLGNQGEWPSHPELLDWLAVDFVENGWDVKRLVKQLVRSGTYRQSSRHRPELADLDPDNRLLARQNARRLEAEFVRDNALFISGLINRELGGPSFMPYQPAGYYEPLNFQVRVYKSDTGEQQYRRGVYSHWQRSFLHPMMANFDAPAREECTAQRTISNTPQQALTLLNDPSFVEAARVFAQSLLQSPDGKGNVSSQLDHLYKRALARSPSNRELESLSRFFEDRLSYYEGEPEEAKAFSGVGYSPMPDSLNPVELAAWSAVTRVILNLNETITRY